MKKLMLSLLGLSVVSVAATSVVSCSTPTKNMEISFEDSSLNVESFNGGSNSIYSGGTSFTTLISQFSNLFTNTHYMYATESYFTSHHDLFIGNDTEKDLSVDGIFVDYSSQGGSEKAYYDQYTDSTTSIASLEGIYNYNKIEGSGATNVATLDTTNSDVNNFFNNFLGKNKGAPDSYFESVTISGGILKIDKDSTIFTEVKSDKDGTNLDFTKTDAEKTYKEINTAVTSDDNTIGNSSANPFSIAILGTDLVQSAPTTFTLTPNDHSSIDEGRIVSDSSGWNMYYTENDGKQSLDTNYSKLVDCGDITLDYTYNSDARNDKAEKYDVKVTISGLQAVYTPKIYQTNKTNADDNQSYVVWQFNGYQFNNKVDTVNTNCISSDNKNKSGYGIYSDINVKSVEISKK